ncbi:MAG TPA: hypothetical protein VF463_15475 [Sphingobium sp.]
MGVEAKAYLTTYGDALEELLTKEIERALEAGDDARALTLDKVLEDLQELGGHNNDNESTHFSS